MAFLQSRRQRRVTQPQQAAAIDWGNPLTRGLGLVVNAGAGQHAVDAVTGARNTLTGAKGAKGPYGGLGFGSTVGVGTTDILVTTNAANPVQRTYLVFANVRGLGGGSLGRLIDRQTTAAVMSLYPDNTTSSILFQHSYASGTAQASVTPLPTFGRPFCLAVSFDGAAGTNIPVSYLNGAPQSVTSRTTGTGAMVSNSDVLTIGNRNSDKARNLDGDNYLTLVWDRILTPAEMASVTFNPWQVFRSTNVGIPFSGAVPLTATIGVTLGSFTVAITAADPDSTAIAVTLGSFVAAVTAANPIAGTIDSGLSSFAVAITAADPDSSSIGLVLGSFSAALTGSVAVSGTVDVFMSPFTLAITAGDPDTGSINLSLNSFVVDIEGGSPNGATIATTLGSFAVAITAADPDSTSIGVTLGEFGVDIEAVIPTAAVINLFMSGFTTNITAFVAATDIAGSIATTLGDFTTDIELESGVTASIALSPDSFTVSITVDVSEPTSDDAIIAVTLGAFTFYGEAETHIELDDDMTLSETIPILLNGLVDGRVWQDATPDNLPRDVDGSLMPFVIWQLMGGQDNEYVEQYPAPSHNHARLQIHAVAPGGIAVDRLIRRVRNALLASSYTVGVYGSPIGTYDAARKLRGRRQQFSLWFRQS